MKFKTALQITAILLSFNIKAQDYHISHYDVAHLYLNPALTGFSDNENPDYKVYLDQRSQWRSIGVKPYLTSYLAFDMPYKNQQKNFGLGAYILNNNGGVGGFNTLSFMVSGSYDILNSSFREDFNKGNKNDKHLLTIGLQLGLFYRSTNPNTLNYDVQYSLQNGGNFDQNIPSNEVYNRMNITRFDANYGLYYKFIEKNKRAHPSAGFSLAHLSRPNESLTSQKSRIPLKWTGHLACDIKLDEKMEITPRALYMNQAKASELSVGFLFYYRLNENETKILAGFDYRVQDACIANLGLNHENYGLRISYDFNTSYLKNYTRGRGAFEISLTYQGKKKTQTLKSTTKF